MTASFDRVSLTVRLPGEVIPFEHGHALRPVSYADGRIRRWFHELLHLWQVLGSGFLANLAGDEMRAVLAFEATGAAGDRSSLLDRFARPDPAAGFSVQALHEALARYWDIHVLNPAQILAQYAGHGVDVDAALAAHSLTWADLRGAPQPGQDVRIGGGMLVDDPATGTVRPYSGRAFDVLMQIEDAYADPYRLMLRIVDSRDAAVLFPLVAHFALQTPHPVRMFAALAQTLTEPAARLTLDGGDIHALWRQSYPVVAGLAARVAVRSGNAALTPGRMVWRGRGRGNAVLEHYARLLELGWQLQGQLLDFAFATPGDPESRQLLTSLFLPAATVFDGGHTHGSSAMATLALMARGAPGLAAEAGLDASYLESLGAVLSGEALAGQALRLRARVAAAQEAALLARYGLAPAR